jgi:hypothetical protein
MNPGWRFAILGPAVLIGGTWGRTARPAFLLVTPWGRVRIIAPALPSLLLWRYRDARTRDPQPGHALALAYALAPALTARSPWGWALPEPPALAYGFCWRCYHALTRTEARDRSHRCAPWRVALARIIR